MGLDFTLNNPLPSSMRSECRKCAKILASFVDPRQSFGPDKIIPPEILANAKGLAILTTFKFAFVGSGRVGSGIIVARQGNGWSAPSGIGNLGGGFGGQIGVELTDFVFIINDYMTLKTFAQAGVAELGGNVSVAAGPVGRSVEAAGGASMKGLGGMFAYSKTKGLFAGVSLEGGGFIERRDANQKLYGQRYKAEDLLIKNVASPPPAADPLMSILNSRIFSTGLQRANTDMYNDIPIYDDRHEDVVWQGQTGSPLGEGVRTDRTGSVGANDYVYRDSPSSPSFNSPKRTSTWQDDVYDRGYNSPGGMSPGGRAPSFASPGLSRSATSRANPGETFDSINRRSRGPSLSGAEEYVYSDKPKPSRPTAPKPVFSAQKTGTVGPNQARAKFPFEAEAAGDLGFKKGDIITIIKRTDKAEDWWTGRSADGREGVFPSNYLEPS